MMMLPVTLGDRQQLYAPWRSKRLWVTVLTVIAYAPVHARIRTMIGTALCKSKLLALRYRIASME